jgi:hypothetical protein
MHVIANHSSKEERSKQKYYCSYCDSVFFSPLYLDNHNKSIVHNNNVINKKISVNNTTSEITIDQNMKLKNELKNELIKEIKTDIKKEIIKEIIMFLEKKL